MSKWRTFEPIGAVLDLKLKFFNCFSVKFNCWCKLKLTFRPPYSLLKGFYIPQIFSSWASFTLASRKQFDCTALFPFTKGMDAHI